MRRRILRSAWSIIGWVLAIGLVGLLVVGPFVIPLVGIVAVGLGAGYLLDRITPGRRRDEDAS